MKEQAYSIFKKYKKYILTIAFLLAVLICVVNFVNYSNKQRNFQELKIYFYDAITEDIYSEEVHVEIAKNENEKMNFLFAELMRGPKKKNNIYKVPPQVKILKTGLTEDRTLQVVFNEKYREMETIDEIIFRTLFVWTMTELEFIDKIDFYIANEGDEDIKVYTNSFNYLAQGLNSFNRENIQVNPDIMNLKRVVKQKVIIYIPDYTEKHLKEVEMTLDLNVDHPQRNVVENILNGFEIDGQQIQIFADGIKVKGAETQSSSVCYIDMSPEFLTNISQDVELEKLQIYSIVNSLAKLKMKTIKEVQFLVDNKRIDMEKYRGKIDLSVPLTYNEEIVGSVINTESGGN